MSHRNLVLVFGGALIGSVASPAAAVTPNVVVTYSYDTDGRVQTVGYHNTVSLATACIVYAYDYNGNRIMQTNSALAEPACAQSAMAPSPQDGQPAVEGGLDPSDGPPATAPDAPAPR
jgi:hypothetical protein